MKKLLPISKQPTLFYKSVLISLLISFLVGCSEKTFNDNPGMKIEPILDKYMNNGRLVFKDQETYQNHLKWILSNQSTPDVVLRFNSGIGLVSMKEIYDNGMELVDNHDEFLVFVEKYPQVFERATYIENSMIFELEVPITFAYLANEDGLFQVGNVIYRVSYNHTIEIIDGDETKIPLIISYNESINDPSIRAKPTSLGAKKQLYYRAQEFSNGDRMVSRHFEVYQNIQWVYSVETTGQTRVLGIWWQKKLNYIAVGWEDGYYKVFDDFYPPYWIPGYPNNSKTNAANIEYVFMQNQYRAILELSYCLATHKGQLKKNGEILIKQDDALEDF